MDPVTSFPKDQIKVLLLENVHPSAHALFQAEGFHLETVKGALGEAELVERIADVHVLGIRSKTRVTDKALGSLDLWQKLWRFGGIELVAQNGGEKCNAPGGSWMALVRGMRASG